MEVSGSVCVPSRLSVHRVSHASHPGLQGSKGGIICLHKNKILLTSIHPWFQTMPPLGSMYMYGLFRHLPTRGYWIVGLAGCYDHVICNHSLSHSIAWWESLLAVRRVSTSGVSGRDAASIHAKACERDLTSNLYGHHTRTEGARD